MKYLINGAKVSFDYPIKDLAVGNIVSFNPIKGGNEHMYPSEYRDLPKGKYKVVSINHEVDYSLSGFSVGFQVEKVVSLVSLQEQEKSTAFDLSA